MAVLKLSGIVPSPSNLVAADTLVGVHGGNTDYQFTGTQLLAFTNANLPSGFTGLANPTASVGLTAVNGSATTAMRSDASPALDQTAAFAFSGLAATTISAAASAAVPLTISGYSLTGSQNQSLVSWSGTANTAGSPDIIKLSITNTALGGSANLLNLYAGAAGATSMLSVGPTGSLTIAGNFFMSGSAAATLGNSTRLSWSGQNVGFVPISSGVLQLNNINAASPVSQTLQAQNAATGNNNGAATFTDIASLSVGNGTSGDRVFQTGKNGNGSGVLATATTALTLKGETQAVVVAAGKTFQVGNAAVTALVPGALAATTNASIVITDSGGQAYRIPCII